jgi:phosphoribosylformylglycinamidine synthase
VSAPAAALKGFAELSAGELASLSRERGLSLNAEEMSVIQEYFRKAGRSPTDAELETLAQTWSEHCKHKTFRAAVDHTETDEMGLRRERRYADLLKDTIVRVTEELRRPWCVSVFKDNAGIVAVDDETSIAFKVETHNHPSALEPYGGAGTGLGGVIRDILGAGLGARPIANTDVFCFAPLDEKPGATKGGALSSRRIFHGVVSGVRDYGNRMGIPTLSGAVVFDEGFRDNPLVFCGTLGLIPTAMVPKEVRAGDRIVVVGGRVGRDGIHGATFSSDNLTEGIPPSVVQIGNPIVQKKMMDALLQARDRRLYRGVTDCGAGGLSSAVGEMAEKTGATVRLEDVPLKYEGLRPWEIWLSESQERMVLAVPPEQLAALTALFRSEDVECADIGEFGGGRLRVLHRESVEVDLDPAFLHDGLPRRRMKSTWSAPSHPAEFPAPSAGRKSGSAGSPEAALLAVLSRPTVASKEWIVRQYDHEVQGRTVLKPFCGPAGRGPSDATALQLDPGSFAGVLLANGLNPNYSRWDPYWMAASALDEAVRNLLAAGAPLDRIALLDNFCGGDPTDPRILGELVRTAQACYDVARAYGAPFISGKDSLYNQFVDAATGERRPIPTTLLISAVAWTDDVRKLVTMDFKRPGDWVFAVGETRDELGGSQYGLARGVAAGRVPRLDPAQTLPLYHCLSEAVARGLVSACHDCSEGGIGVALAEMALAGQLGVYADLRRVPVPADLKAEGRTDKVLFSESNGRFLVEVPAKARRAFLACFDGQPVAPLGQVREQRRVQATGLDGKGLSWSLEDIEAAWGGGLKP